MQNRTPFKGVGFEVVCPQCRGRFHVTTEFFDNTKAATGKMFALKEKYGKNGYNWSTFSASSGMRGGDLECPQCGAGYCAGGHYIKSVDPIPGFVAPPVEKEEEPEKEPEAAVAEPLEAATEPVEEEPEPPKKELPGFFICSYCGKECKSKSGLASHEKSCKAKMEGNNEG